jgi:hypothetical protein
MFRNSPIAPNTPNTNVPTTYDNLVEQLTCLYNKPVGGKENPSGLAPVYIEGRFPTGEVEISGKVKNFKATAITALNQTNFKTANLIQIIKSGRLACAVYQNGVMTELNVHQFWYDRIEKENAWEIVIKCDEEHGHIYPDNNDDIGIGKITNEAYIKMVKDLSFYTFIKV